MVSGKRAGLWVGGLRVWDAGSTTLYIKKFTLLISTREEMWLARAWNANFVLY